MIVVVVIKPVSMPASWAQLKTVVTLRAVLMVEMSSLLMLLSYPIVPSIVLIPENIADAVEALSGVCWSTL